jgi:hypothetical protein
LNLLILINIFTFNPKDTSEPNYWNDLHLYIIIKMQLTHMIIYSTHHAVREAMGDDDVAWIRHPRWPETIHLDMLVAGNVGLHHWKTRKTLTEITKRKIRTNQETEKTLDEMGKHSEKQISDPSADKTWWNKMQKHTKRKNVPAIGEIQRKNCTL